MLRPSYPPGLQDRPNEVGIGIALLLERRAQDGSTRGLGLTGALVINLCFGLVLAAWLLFGPLELLPRGSIVLWGLVAILVGLSGIELLSERSHRLD